MTEVWDQLGYLQSRRQLCMDDAQQIRQPCTQDHEKQTVFECDECYGRLIGRLRSRYLDSSDPEWFTGRRAFLQDLEALFSAAERREIDPRDIEARIQEEKRSWYRESVRNTANRLMVDDTSSRDGVLDKLHDRDLAFEDLVRDVGDAVGRAAASSSSDIGDLVRRIVAAKEPLDRFEIYREAFFPGEQGSQKYLDMLKSGMAMELVALRVLEDRQASTGARLQKEKHIRRLEELRRGRTAHEMQKTKNRERFADARVAKEFYELPPCNVCSTAPDTGDFLSCCLCQVLAGQGVKQQSTVYCSNKCFAQGHDSHVEQTHLCVSGDKCIILNDEDVNMDAVSSDTFLCKECISLLSKPSVFCSARCADLNFQTHREQIHLPARRERPGVVFDDSSKLVFDDAEKSKYHAGNIEEHIVSVGEALQEFEKKTGIVVSIID